MNEDSIKKPVYDLEDRTFQLAKDARIFVKTLPLSIANKEDSKQLIIASGSVGANYREANESLSKKDFHMRIKISRKETKESAYRLRLLVETTNLENNNEGIHLKNEATEIKKLVYSIIEKSRLKCLSFSFCSLRFT